VDASRYFRRIFTTDGEGVLRVCTLDPEELLRIAAGRLPRPLDPADRERYAGLLGR
jgi:hypothetical protein